MCKSSGRHVLENAQFIATELLNPVIGHRYRIVHKLIDCKNE